MNKNSIIISEKKLAKLSSILPESLLRNEYEINGLSDAEISEKIGISQSWVCKLRKIYGIKTDPRYRLRRNKLRFISLSEKQINFLYGTLLGDSFIAIQNSGEGYWGCMHCLKQENYLLKKAEILNPFVAKVFYGERPFFKSGKSFPYIKGRTHTHSEFTALRKEFYPEGVKRVNANILQKLSPEGFAFWFMDDGFTTGYGFDIVTYDEYFKTKEPVDIFADILNLKVSITWNSKDEGNIHVLKESHDTAWEYIRQELVSCFNYKIPKKYSQDNQHPSLEGNLLEGSTTGGSLNSREEHDDNTRFDKVICQGTPDICGYTDNDTV